MTTLLLLCQLSLNALGFDSDGPYLLKITIRLIYSPVQLSLVVYSLHSSMAATHSPTVYHSSFPLLVRRWLVEPHHNLAHCFFQAAEVITSFLLDSPSKPPFSKKPLIDNKKCFLSPDTLAPLPTLRRCGLLNLIMT